MSKLGANIFLISTTYGLQQFAKIGAVKVMRVFFHSICATDLNLGNKILEEQNCQL